MNTLAFGYNHGLADDVRAAWGARLIVNQDGYTDFLANRADRFGDEGDLADLFGWLDGDGVFKTARGKASDLLRSYTMKTRESEHFVLYEDDKGVVVGNTNASAGYLYVAAWLKSHEGVTA